MAVLHFPQELLKGWGSNMKANRLQRERRRRRRRRRKRRRRRRTYG